MRRLFEFSTAKCDNRSHTRVGSYPLSFQLPIRITTLTPSQSEDAGQYGIDYPAADIDIDMYKSMSD
jgi:hypothetical protein